MPPSPSTVASWAASRRIAFRLFSPSARRLRGGSSVEAAAVSVISHYKLARPFVLMIERTIVLTKEADTMNLITRDELRAKLHRGDEFKLVMTLSALSFRSKHIPTSVHYETVAEAFDALDPAEE